MRGIINPDYLRINEARARRWHSGSIHNWTPNDWMTALVGEVGELANILKKLKREEDGIPGNTMTEVELLEAAYTEWADCLAYLALLGQAIGMGANSMDGAVTDKFNEVSERAGFPERI